MEILGAIKSGKIAESNDNDGSALPPFKIIALDYLTQDAYWFINLKEKIQMLFGLNFEQCTSLI